MIESMQAAINKIVKLPESKQKRLASLLEEELKWQESEKNALNDLDHLIKEAKSEYKSGETKDTDW